MSNDFHDDTLILARETLTGDLRDLILDTLKHEKNPMPWNMRGEIEQREVIYRVTEAVGRAVERAVEIISADGRKVIHATLSQVTVKDGIKGVIEVSKGDALRHELMDATGQSILIVVSDASEFKGERGAVEPEPDQKALFDQTDAGRDDSDEG